MKHFVERTCTVVRGREEESGGKAEPSRPGETESRSLESFREAAAYVLLGAPGSGKTEAFRREAEREGGHYVSARDFLTFDPLPQWKGGTIYIDGLDETRAGATDGRTPFDGIRAKLGNMGSPRFRLSCREADWFGANDRERLSAVGPNREVQVLRLDPLSRQGVLEILERNHDVDDPAAFVAEAGERGVEDLLPNPQNLRMLVDAVAEADEGWPQTRTATFDLACRKLVSEENPEHQIACGDTVDTGILLDTAGELCALLLLAGKAGVTLPGTTSDASHPRLDGIPGSNWRLLRLAVGTNLFTMPSEGRLAPGHRQIAEFLAARHLAARIADGLPVGRVLALLTGFDGGIISEYGGLGGWLAALSPAAQVEIIERDPLGVLLYGDAEQFPPHQKRRLLRALRAEVDRNPWLVFHSRVSLPLRPLAGPDLIDDLRQALANPARDESQQSFVFLIVEAMQDAATLPAFAGPLMAIVRDDSWWMTIRRAALRAYIRARRDDHGVAVTLRSLLDDVYTGVVATRDDNLLGILLAELYPRDLPLADLVGYLREPARRNHRTRYDKFWTGDLIEKSTVQQMVKLLDLLRVPMERVRAESRDSDSPSAVRLIVRPPMVLLRYLLERSPQSLSQERVAYWLEFATSPGLSHRGVVGDAEYFRDWLSGQPDTYRAIIENGVARCHTDGDFSACMGRVKRSLLLLEARPPQDYGIWCADQALGADDGAVARWFVREAAEFVFYEKDPADPQRQAVARKLRDDAPLGRVFEDRLGDLEEASGLKRRRTGQTRPARNDTRFDELRLVFKKHESALRGNECRPHLLHTLAVAYFAGYSDVSGETPRDRLQDLLGPDDDLVEAGLAGLRGAVCRPDLPKWTEVSKLAAEGRTHYLAHPFMAGLEELSAATETSDCQLDNVQTRLAVAIHFAVPGIRQRDHADHPPDWLRGCLARDPDTVAEVWSRCARAQLLRGEESLPDTDRLVRERGYAQLAQAASVPLLKSFPVRCKAGQLRILANLLVAAIAHGDRTQLLELIESKLGHRSLNSGQRVHWLTAGFLLQPDAYCDHLESYVSGRARRVQRLAEMVLGQPVWDDVNAPVLETLIRLIGPYTTGPPDTWRAFYVTWPIQADQMLQSFISRLSEDTSDAATGALESLAGDARLVRWRSKLLDCLDRQRGNRREAVFANPNPEQIADVLRNGRPVNAADLAALALETLHELSRRIRDGATSDWRQYWNVDGYNRVLNPKPENACRDALLSDLMLVMAPLGVEALAEGVYADDKRADIRLSVPGCNVPIEIKRSCHDNWWSSIKTQLISKYTRDSGTNGYGIYLVFWYGEADGCQPEPASGRRPKLPEELRQALVDSLTRAERRKILICVIDVSKPQVLSKTTQ